MRRFFVVLMALCACKCGTNGPVTQPSAPQISTEAPETAEAESEGAGNDEAPESFFSNPEPREQEPPTAEQASAFARTSNAFGFAIYGQARGADGNLAISPASITLAFEMVFGGARGETAAEMARTMGLVGDADAVHEAAGRVLARWNDPNREDYELRVVDRLFGEQSARFEQDYLTLTRTTYAAPFEGVDFHGAPNEQREHINEWVAQQTRERITDLLPPTSITADTGLVLVNAVYFLGAWAEPFDSALTRDERFTLADGSTIEVPLMRQTENLKHAHRGDVTVVELPYRGDELVMTLIIPDSATGLPAIEGQLSGDQFERWVGLLSQDRVRLVMPRFEMSTRMTLSTALKALGMRLAFDDGAADFFGIGRPADPDERLYVSEAYHQVFVKVDEEGTEAAAATAVTMGFGGGRPAEPIEIRADRPFLFAIREPSSGTILFMGRVVDPRPQTRQ